MMDVMAIYLAYPRHREPRVAVRAIERAIMRICKGESGKLLLPTTAYAYLMERVQRYKRSPAGRNITREGNFIPYPATWFNASSYLEDEAEWYPAGELSRQQQGKRREAREAQERADWNATLDKARIEREEWKKLSEKVAMPEIARQ